MNSYHYRQDTIVAIISLLVVVTMVIWTELDTESLHRMIEEDGPIESLSAFLFGLSSVCFLVFARRSSHLKGKGKLIYFFAISWAVLMFVFMGEEISWGQRIFGIATPEALREINLQQETNIHNIAFLNTFLGGKYRYLSIMMIATGLLIPLFAMTSAGKDVIQRFGFPVSPMCYAPLFVGAYLYGNYYYSQIQNDAAEVREFLMSVGMFGFALYGAISPCALFRSCESKT